MVSECGSLLPVAQIWPYYPKRPGYSNQVLSEATWKPVSDQRLVVEPRVKT